MIATIDGFRSIATVGVYYDHSREMLSMPDELEYMTTDQVAAALGCRDTTVRRLAQAHNLGRRVGKRIKLFTAAELETLRQLLKPRPGNPNWVKRTADDTPGEETAAAE